MQNSVLLESGKPVSFVNLRHGMIFGRSREADVQVGDVGVSRKHARLDAQADGGWRVLDLGSQAGTRVNGRLFQEHELVYGDLLNIGSVNLRFDGTRFVLAAASVGLRVEAEAIVKKAGERTLLHSISLAVEPGLFVGILGTSGAGKSTLLDVLSGIRKASSGRALVGGLPVDVFLSSDSAKLGYVPQEDIIHTDLTVEEALNLCARMRLSREVPDCEVLRLVAETMETLGLTARAQVKVARLSGGQRKRVSIAAEILTKPPVLFLDEPSSGLDPASESKLMELLRNLANGGCTVICTTHVMENVFLFDQLVIVTSGRLVYHGPPAAARGQFGIDHFKDLYDTLEAEPAELWEQRFRALGSKPHLSTPSAAGSVSPATIPEQRGPRYFTLLMQRQWAIMTSERKNVLLLVGQPLILGALVAWMGDNVELKLFLTYLSTLWFGCSNAGQEIVKELPIYRRERLAGLPRAGYLASKLLFWGLATSVQAMILYGIVHFGKSPLVGDAGWQVAGLMGAAWASVVLGTALSAIVKTTTQAVMLVPLLLLPQIVFSGFVLPRLADDPVKRRVSSFMPSYSVQQIMDLSLFWKELTVPLQHEEHQQARNSMKRDGRMEVGAVFERADAGVAALLRLAATVTLGTLAAWMALASKERST